MDPLSISSAIVGFLGFLGQISTIISKVASAQKDEKKDIEDLTKKIEYFDRIFSDLQTLVNEASQVSGNITQDYSLLEECLKTCNTQLQEFVDKFNPPVSRWKGMVRRFTWPLKQEQHDELIKLVEECKSSIHLELTLKQSRQTQASFACVQSDAQYEKVMEWLRKEAVEINSNFDRAVHKRHPGTGLWFLEGADFQEFINGNRKYLWLYGKPGAGKTILSGSIISTLREIVEANSQNGLAYFFFSYTDTAKQSVFKMLSSIATQLLTRITNIPSRVITLYTNERLRPPLSVLLEVIMCLCECLQRTYIIFDALDEVAVDQREHLTKSIGDMISKAENSGISLKILSTSRREDYLVDGLRGLPFKEICLEESIVDRDINEYVTEIVDQDPKISKWSSELRVEIVSTLTKKANGMFRWVECQIESLKKCRRPYDVRRALSSLPESLDETYRRILLAIDEADRIYAARLLAWVVFTPYPVCLYQLAEAIIFEPDSVGIDPERRFSDPASLLEFGGSLFSRATCKNGFSHGPEAHDLTLSHYSVKEYLVSERIKQDDELSVYSSILTQGCSYIMDAQIKYWQTLTLCYRPENKLDERWLEQNYPLTDHLVNPLCTRISSLEPGPQRQHYEERVAHLICNNTCLFEDMYSYGPQEPVSFLAMQRFLHGLDICLARGKNLHAIELDEDLGLLTPFSVCFFNSDPIPTISRLIELGAQDLIFSTTTGIAVSPGLAQAVCLGVVQLSLELVSLLLRHGSVVNSPDYVTGTLLTPVLVHSERSSEDMDAVTFKALCQLLVDYGGYLDPVFPRLDGYVESFVGESVEYYAALNDLEGLQIVITHGASIGRPVTNPETVSMLFKMPRDCFDPENEYGYFTCNAFSASLDCFEVSEETFDETAFAGRVALLLSHGGDLNALDCLIGYGGEHVISNLQACTALDLVESLGRLELCHDKFAGFNVVNLAQHCSGAASILKTYGARVLPRQTIDKRVWRILSPSDYLAFQYYPHLLSLFSSFYYSKSN